MKIAKVALFLIMSNFVSPDTEESVIEQNCLNCCICQRFADDEIEFYSLDME